MNANSSTEGSSLTPLGDANAQALPVQASVGMPISSPSDSLLVEADISDKFLAEFIEPEVLAHLYVVEGLQSISKDYSRPNLRLGIQDWNTTLAILKQ